MSEIFTRLFVYFFVFNVTVFFPKMNAMMLLMTIINNNKDKILFLPLGWAHLCRRIDTVAAAVVVVEEWWGIFL